MFILRNSRKDVMKFGYYLFLFLLSLYLLFSMIVEYTGIFESLKGTNHVITKVVVLFFVIDLVIQWMMVRDIKRYLQEQWISIVAVLAGVPIILVFDLLAVSGILVLNKLYLLVKMFKFLKVFKVVKTVKLKKKTKKKYQKITANKY